MQFQDEIEEQVIWTSGMFLEEALIPPEEVHICFLQVLELCTLRPGSGAAGKPACRLPFL